MQSWRHKKTGKKNGKRRTRRKRKKTKMTMKLSNDDMILIVTARRNAVGFVVFRSGYSLFYSLVLLCYFNSLCWFLVLFPYFLLPLYYCCSCCFFSCFLLRRVICDILSQTWSCVYRERGRGGFMRTSPRPVFYGLLFFFVIFLLIVVFAVYVCFVLYVFCVRWTWSATGSCSPSSPPTSAGETLSRLRAATW